MEVVTPGAGHWLMEEAPTQTIRAIRDFIAQQCRFFPLLISLFAVRTVQIFQGAKPNKNSLD